MTITVLTSSRADYGIYLPLLKALHRDPGFDLRLIVFGTHLSSFHGHTIDQIQRDGFRIDYCVENVMASDTPMSIASSMALTSMRFAEIWNKEQFNYDRVICLGDRYEMFSAVSAAAPFGLRFAHIHGGETTLGAIDNQFRHCLSVFSDLHFVATRDYAERVKEITGSEGNIHVVGSLSLENLKEIELLSPQDFLKCFGIDMHQPTILITYHPETVGAELNKERADAVVNALKQFGDYQLVITMPNADTSGNIIRRVYQEFASSQANVRLVENFGTRGYFSCMKLSRLVVGNSSSGIIEAASFQKFVVNIGDRQKGRAVSANVIHTPNNENAIVKAIRQALQKGEYNGENIYYQGGATEKIMAVLQKENSLSKD